MTLLSSESIADTHTDLETLVGISLLGVWPAISCVVVCSGCLLSLVGRTRLSVSGHVPLSGLPRHSPVSHLSVHMPLTLVAEVRGWRGGLLWLLLRRGSRCRHMWRATGRCLALVRVRVVARAAVSVRSGSGARLTKQVLLRLWPIMVRLRMLLRCWLRSRMLRPSVDGLL